jgi:hypothetical protein
MAFTQILRDLLSSIVLMDLTYLIKFSNSLHDGSYYFILAIADLSWYCLSSKMARNSWVVTLAAPDRDVTLGDPRPL